MDERKMIYLDDAIDSITDELDKITYLHDAIEAIAGHDTTNGTVKAFTGKEVINILRSLPSVQLERESGEWVDDGDPLTFTCSKCGYSVARHNNTNFCPNCGADMRGKEV